MKTIYKGHKIDCHREKALGGWDNLYYSIFRLSDMYEVTSGFTTGSDKVKDYIKYMKEFVDEYMDNPAILGSLSGDEMDEEELEEHIAEIAKSQNLTTPWGAGDSIKKDNIPDHKFEYAGYEIGSGEPLSCKVCGIDKSKHQ